MNDGGSMEKQPRYSQPSNYWEKGRNMNDGGGGTVSILQGRQLTDESWPVLSI